MHGFHGKTAGLFVASTVRGAPKGNANGSYRHGFYTHEAKAEHRLVSDLLSQSPLVRQSQASPDSESHVSSSWGAAAHFLHRETDASGAVQRIELFVPLRPCLAAWC